MVNNAVWHFEGPFKANEGEKDALYRPDVMQMETGAVRNRPCRCRYESRAQSRRAARSGPAIVYIIGFAAMVSSVGIPLVSSEAGDAMLLDTAPGKGGSDDPFYTVLIDAGSSGSRVHVFKMADGEKVLQDCDAPTRAQDRKPCVALQLQVQQLLHQLGKRVACSAAF